ncbi:hypothetical protein ACFX5U_07635 [Sphingobacterium sp. SG20118]|uniref:hypothetical protein n=1 Tax=Sphingobacterium sp. SG20118 TaxID=3367156 RepID=UPI0037DFC273
MIYISAQPDELFFIWQLELQLSNFSNLGIPKEQIHVLFGIEQKPVSEDLEVFVDKYKDFANFYLYFDLRENTKYRSSIRPNIIKQHFIRFPELRYKTLFYHDSDILFSRIPQVPDLDIDNINYVSDTRNYLDIYYIRHFGGEKLLQEMVNIVGIPTSLVELNKGDTGGAQYVLKNVDADFWDKVERDSENLYTCMLDFNRSKWEKDYSIHKTHQSESDGIQAWCADMWAVLWNLWYFGKEVKIHPEMNFSWPDSPIHLWDELAIQHYSGKHEDAHKYFKKSVYRNFPPWYDKNLRSIPNTNCSYKIVSLINQKREEYHKARPVFKNSIVIFYTQSYDENIFDSLKVQESFLSKYFEMPIFLLLNHEEKFYNINNEEIYLKELNKESGIMRRFILLPLKYLIDTVIFEKHLLNSDLNLIYDFSAAYNLDTLFSQAFTKVLEIQMLQENKGKFNQTHQLKSIYILDQNNFESYCNCIPSNLPRVQQEIETFILN